MKKLIVSRRSSQIFFLSLFIYILWSTAYPLQGIIRPNIIFKMDPLVTLFTALSERVIIPGIALSIAMLAAALIAGRIFCGWVCPLGSLIDGAGALRGKIRALPDGANAAFRKVKYIILGIIAAGACVGIQLAWILDPVGLAARFVSLNLIPAATMLTSGFFIFVIKTFRLYGPFYDFYRSLESTVLGVKVYYFSHAAAIFLFFIVVVLSSLFVARLWCRFVCPLGGLYALSARRPFLKRTLGECTSCGICKSRCRMGAIRDDMSYVPGECILCMDCIYDCPERVTRFAWGGPGPKPSTGRDRMSRRQFLFLLGSALVMSGFKRGEPGRVRNVIRPPGALAENDFVDRCVRCGNCMKVCPTNVIQPVLLQAGLRGVWTPALIPEIGYCEYNCTLCGDICPTGAIRRLPVPVKQATKIGVARVDKGRCIPWSSDNNCIVCEEQCPVPDKAIKLFEESAGGRRKFKPYVDDGLCIGCGTCQNKCPVRPVRAIRVKPL
ncbi:MAG: 4Fe-4S binding protein [Candidatus Omnitrophica bacterium]|nr:4Fe-4S binding protein [Candidatus Omnitrophota bacterium]